MNDKPEITLIGRLPSPIGGVTIHNERLYYKLLDAGYKCEHIHPRSGIIKLVSKVLKSEYVYVSINNRIIIFLLVVLLRVLSKDHAVCFHGNVNNILGLNGIFQKLAIKIAKNILVLNKESLAYARKVSSGAITYISAYIEYDLNREVDINLIKQLSLRAKGYSSVVCSNAFSKRYSYDGKEIYGILELIDYFEKFPDILLIISNPDGQYERDFQSSGRINSNIYFVTHEHNFLDVLDVANVFIRNTSTDGDSLSIHEALSKGVITYATDVVQRPVGVISYGQLTELDNSELLLSINTKSEVKGMAKKNVFDFLSAELEKLK